MRVILESTTKIVTLDGMQCRIWEGHTDFGIPVHAYIPRIAADENADLAQFEKELKEQRAPSPEIEAIPMRLIL